MDIDFNELLQDYSDDNIEEDLLFSSSSEDTSSSSDSDDSGENRHHNIQNFLGTVNLYSERDFKSHFRLKRSTVLHLIELYKLEKGEVNLVGRPPLKAEIEVYMFLWYMANTITFRQLGNMFGVAKSTAWASVNKLAKYLIKISPDYIKWPSQRGVSRICEGFESLHGIPGVIGAIDGTHIKIKAPRTDPVDYYNRKKYYSISMQVVVDYEKKIIDVHCGEPGSIHDARILRRTELFKRAEESPQALFPQGTFLLGDSAYPCKSWLVPPFKDNGALTDTQKKFNSVHSSTRVVVENAIGLLKTRFRRLLNFSEQTNIPLIVNLSYAACVLHNMCIMQQDDYAISSENGAIDDDDYFLLNANAEMQIQNRRDALVRELLSKNVL